MGIGFAVRIPNSTNMWDQIDEMQFELPATLRITSKPSLAFIHSESVSAPPWTQPIANVTMRPLEPS